MLIKNIFTSTEIFFISIKPVPFINCFAPVFPYNANCSFSNLSRLNYLPADFQLKNNSRKAHIGSHQ